MATTTRASPGRLPSGNTWRDGSPAVEPRDVDLSGCPLATTLRFVDEGRPNTVSSTGSRASISAVRDLLERNDYSAEGISRLGIDLGMGARAPDIPALLHAIELIEPLATLIRLFALGQDVPAATAEAALGTTADDLVEAGLARRDGDGVSPLVRLTPWRGLVLAHDPDPPSDLWPEHVSGPTPAAETLLNLVSATADRALKLGTGCGTLARAVGASQSSVVATDVNPAA